jgi:threonine aldolase
MNFCSDNTAGAHPKILAALSAANGGAAMPYGNDALTQKVERKVSDLFERDCAVFLVGTGTSANALALAALAPNYGAVFCHPESHINIDECGAPEFFTGGAKLVGIDGAHGKIAAGDLEQTIKKAGIGVVHHVQPAAVSITQATEAGTVYRPAEIATLAAVAHAHGLTLHMDGARFANALVHVGCTPAEMTWRAGVDAVSFGATKNGAFAAEAVVFFDPARAASFGYRRKRAGHLWSKMRFLAAQLDAYLSDELWLQNARHANRLAAELARGLSAINAVRFEHPVEANELFVTLPETVIRGLEADGFRFYRWMDETSTTLRLVTSFETDPAHVADFIASARRHAGAAAA